MIDSATITLKKGEFSLETFNDCPGEDILDELGDIELDIIDAVITYHTDYTTDSYVNSRDTLVVRITGDACPIETARMVAALSQTADEVDVHELDGFAIARFWWG